MLLRSAMAQSKESKLDNENLKNVAAREDKGKEKADGEV